MAEKQELDYREAFLPTMEALLRDGVLLVSLDGTGKPGGMTFSWATIGHIWGRAIFTIVVRPSRHTFHLLEATGDFTVNVLRKDMGHALGYWGKYSSRNVDKWAQTGLRPAPARKVASPIVEQGILHYECRIVHRHDLAPEKIAPELVPAYYPSGDYHRIYHGEIVACYGL